MLELVRGRLHDRAREALVTARVETQPGRLQALLEIVAAPTLVEGDA